MQLWKIIVETKRLGGGAPMLEYYIVAIEGEDAALKELRARANLTDEKLNLVGEADVDDFRWLDLADGDIRLIQRVS